MPRDEATGNTTDQYDGGISYYSVISYKLVLFIFYPRFVCMRQIFSVYINIYVGKKKKPFNRHAEQI